MKNELQNAPIRGISPLTGEENKMAADECDDCNEINNMPERPGSEKGYLCRSCWAAAHTTVKFVLEG